MKSAALLLGRPAAMARPSPLEGVCSHPFYLAAMVALKNARTRGIEWTLDAKDLNAILVGGNWRCAVTNVKFDYKPAVDGKRRPWAPSLDRIRSGEGYVPGNVRFVCVAANLAMNEWGEDVLQKMAHSLVSSKRLAR